LQAICCSFLFHKKETKTEQNNHRENNFIYNLGLQYVPFTNNISLVPGAHKIQKIQNLERFQFSMYKVLIHLRSTPVTSFGSKISGKLIPYF